MTSGQNIRWKYQAKTLQLAGASLLSLLLASHFSSPALAETQLPFEISVDGQRVDGSTIPAPSVESETGTLDVQVKFDGLGVNPILNVSTVPPRASYRTGDRIDFLASLNYGAWIDHAEIRIYERGNRKASGLYHVLKVSNQATAQWQLPPGAPKEMEYVLRVYDEDGRYDETLPLPISVTEKDFATHDRGQEATAPGYSEDRTAVRNIDVFGGVVTVSGSNVPIDHDVTVAGEPVPVDPEGKFVVQRIFPPGAHQVAVSVTKDGEGLDFTRDVEVPENEWFYVGLADFTAGYKFGDNIEDVRPGEFGDDTYTRGRLAFYVKGKIKGRYILTAAADTGEESLKSIFKGLDEKDPRQFLKRLDPDDYYPVYGDDSTSVEDAPTRGKFYVKLQRGPSHVMWGNFKSNITGSKIIKSERALYGAQGVYRSNKPAVDGGAATALDVHAALPGTLPQHDIFRGTGGSAYFLKHQDITPGSETVTIEVRNSVTGWVTAYKTLKYGADYDFDYVQGVVILRQPLSSSSSVGTENYLVANYEFSPAARDVNGYVLGGRAQQWLGDHLRVGVTALKEKTDAADQKLYGADVRIQGKSENTYIEAEVAQSEGPGFGSTYSPDGGLTLQTNTTAGISGKKALAYRVEANVALEDLTDGTVTGSLGGRYERFGKGFSSPEVDAVNRRTLWGVEGDVELSEKVKVAGTFSEEKQGDGRLERQGIAKINARLSDELSIEPYVRYTEKQLVAPATDEQGKRTDTGIKLLYAWDEDTEAYIFGHATVARKGTLHNDNRVGIGGKRRLAEKVTAAAEASYGTQGVGGSATLNYEPTADDRYYIGYQLDPSRDIADNWPFALVGDDIGTIVMGARHRFNDQWAAFTEDNFDVFGERMSLTQIYGVTYTPDAAWTVTGGAELGAVYDDTIDPLTGLKNEDFDRTAISLAIAYKIEEGVDGRIKGEVRVDDSDNDTRDMTSYLLQASLGVKVSEEWRAIASFDGVFTDATDSVRGGDYAEGSVGFAYRPTTSDRLSALVKYTFLYDDPGVDQVSVDGTTSSPAQRSHIFSGDVSYDVLPQLTLGAKYGMRIGEVRERVAGAAWEDSQVHLAVLRADFHLVHEFDALLEGRALWSPTTDELDLGAVAAIYRHFGDNFKVGVGYNFGKFSDDLSDLSYNDHGVFLNVIGKF